MRCILDLQRQHETNKGIGERSDRTGVTKKLASCSIEGGVVALLPQKGFNLLDGDAYRIVG